jgi:hypothetical protein
MPQVKKIHSEQSNLPFLKDNTPELKDNTPETKPCTGCGEEKELDQFRLKKKGLPTRRSKCKDCTKDATNKKEDEYKKANEERRKNGTQEEWIKSFHPDGTKLCTNCKVVRDLSEFGVKNRGKSGIENHCRGCEGFKAARRRSKKKPWKAMELTMEEYLDIYYRDNCRGCNNPNPRGVDRIDSSKPYTIENTQPLCYYCNTAKLDRTMSEWLDHTRQILEHQEKLNESPRNKEENTTHISNGISIDIYKTVGIR